MVAAAIACLSGTILAAQDAQQSPKKGTIRILPPAVEISSPFDLNAPQSERVDLIEFRSEGSITAPDQKAVGDAMPSIEAKASVEGFDLNQGKWNYQQIVCPVLPERLLLLFARNNGANDLSMFSAVVPRSSNGNVLILPILHRSYTPYTPAPANLMTITAFNDLRSHDQTGKKMDWLTAGLCYAALTGNQVVLSQSTENAGKTAFPLVMNPLLEIGDNGITVVRFMDVAVPQQPNEWALTFDKNGKLLKVANSLLPIPKVTLLP